jgi:hypothetical protein
MFQTPQPQPPVPVEDSLEHIHQTVEQLLELLPVMVDSLVDIQLEEVMDMEEETSPVEEVVDFLDIQDQEVLVTQGLEVETMDLVVTNDLLPQKFMVDQEFCTHEM